MAREDFTKLLKLLNRYKYILFGAIVLTSLLIIASLYIYYRIDDYDNKDYWEKFAEFLMNAGQTILGTIVIGGGLGGVINFIFEEMKSEEEAKEKNKLFRQNMLSKLQQTHDQVELARVLIKSHKSGKTYGEQIRERIMPSLIILQDFKRQLSHVEDQALIQHMSYLQVSLTYMIAYLSVLIEEFEKSYLRISNVQTYQDALANHMRVLFTALSENKTDDTTTLEKQKRFLERAQKRLEELDEHFEIGAVWQEMEKLDYAVNDFICELRSNKGRRSLYYKIFLLHYFNCTKLLKSRKKTFNNRLVSSTQFKTNLAELRRIEEIKASDQPLTKSDSLTRRIMADELFFNFEDATRISDNKS